MNEPNHAPRSLGRRIALAVVSLVVIGCTASSPSPDPASVVPSASSSEAIQASPSSSADPTPTATATPAATPEASPEVTPSPSPAETVGPTLDAVARFGPMAGWASLATLNSGDLDANGTAIVDLDAPPDIHVLLVSTTCAGDGSLQIDAGRDDWRIDCPTRASRPERYVQIRANLARTIRVRASDDVAFRIRVEGAPTLVEWPVVLIGAAQPRDHMVLGCGVTIQLAWGYSAGDSCGQDVPENPSVIVRASGGKTRLTVRGWKIIDPTTSCGVFDADLRFQSRKACKLTMTPDGPSDVVVAGIPGADSPWIVRLNAYFENDLGDRVQASYFASVTR